MFLSKKKNLKQSNKRPVTGHYAIEADELNWHHCREEFSKIFTKNSKGLYFSCIDKEENVCAFIEKTEEILMKGALLSIDQSKFFKTNYNFAIWIEPSNFWMRCNMKRSLFTMLLRCGIFYNYNNYEDAIFNGNEYSKITKNAIKRFLFGFTNCNKKQSFEGLGKGWASFFSNVNDSFLYENLQSEQDYNRIKLPFVGDNSLWL